MYHYDPEKHAFKITNDSSRYTVSELSWQYLEDFEVYSFTLIDLEYVDIRDMKAKPLQDVITYSWDVSLDGTFVIILTDLNYYFSLVFLMLQMY